MFWPVNIKPIIGLHLHKLNIWKGLRRKIIIIMISYSEQPPAPWTATWHFVGGSASHSVTSHQVPPHREILNTSPDWLRWQALSLHTWFSYWVWAEKFLKARKLLCHTWILHNVRLEFCLTPTSCIGSV